MTEIAKEAQERYGYTDMLYDRVSSGHDPENMIFKRIRSKAPGIEHCGLGQISAKY